MFLYAGRVAGRVGLSSSFGCALFMLLVGFACVEARAQGGTDITGTGGRHIIQGRIVYPSGRRSDGRLKVRLESSSAGELSVLADANGTFTFSSLMPGSYAVVIEGGDDFETVRESVYIESDVSNPRRSIAIPTTTRPYTVQIYLRPKQQGSPEMRAGVLDASLASIPKPAVELYHKAIGSVNKGESDKAVEHLKGAIALHPNFPLALSALGVQYLRMKQPDKAAEVLQSSLKLAPDDYQTLLTYGIALYDKKDFDAAETQLRLALKRNNASPSAHLYLGLTLIRKRNLDEAEKELRLAATTGGAQMSVAHYYLGGLYWGKRDYRRAADELETYLRLSPNAADATRIRATVKELRGKQ